MGLCESWTRGQVWHPSNDTIPSRLQVIRSSRSNPRPQREPRSVCPNYIRRRGCVSVPRPASLSVIRAWGPQTHGGSSHCLYHNSSAHPVIGGSLRGRWTQERQVSSRRRMDDCPGMLLTRAVPSRDYDKPVLALNCSLPTA